MLLCKIRVGEGLDPPNAGCIYNRADTEVKAGGRVKTLPYKCACKQCRGGYWPALFFGKPAKRYRENRRNFFANFVIISENVLDKWGKGWYHNRARVGENCACTAMMQEIAAKAGNFCGVCPVIGRLNCFCLRCVYRCGRRLVGLASAIFHGLE